MSKIIVLSCASDELTEFQAWLRSKGYEAHVGNTNRTTVDGEVDDATMNALWLEYCNSDIV